MSFSVKFSHTHLCMYVMVLCSWYSPTGTRPPLIPSDPLNRLLFAFMPYMWEVILTEHFKESF